MTQEALKRIELIFQTEIKILKYNSPGLSHFSLKASRPLLRDFSVPPNCLEGLERLDFMQIRGLPRDGNNNLRLLYLCVLVMAYEDSSMRLLKRIKNLAYDESQPLTYLSRDAVPEQFRGYYDDKLMRKLFVEFFHLVGSRRSANKVIRFIEYHPILDFAFMLLFKRISSPRTPSSAAFFQHVQTGELMAGIFPKLEMQPDLPERRLRIGEYRYLAEDERNIYLTCHRQDDLDIDFPNEGMSSSDSEEESGTAASTTVKVSSMKQSHCGSNQTKVTQEEDPSKWSTPVKQETPFISQSMIPSRESVPSSKPYQYFKCSNGMEKQDKVGSLEQYELRCGQIKDKINKLETDVEHYNSGNVNSRTKTLKDESPNPNPPTKIFPLCFKQRQSERKMSSEYFDTSFFRQKNQVGNTPNNMPSTSRHAPQTTTFFKTTELPPRPPRMENKGSREGLAQSGDFQFIRISSTTDITTHATHSRANSNASEVDIRSGGTGLLKQKPKSIMVRKI